MSSFKSGLWETELYKFSMARLPMGFRYAVKFYSNMIVNEGNIIVATCGKCKCGLRPATAPPVHRVNPV